MNENFNNEGFDANQPQDNPPENTPVQDNAFPPVENSFDGTQNIPEPAQPADEPPVDSHPEDTAPQYTAAPERPFVPLSPDIPPENTFGGTTPPQNNTYYSPMYSTQSFTPPQPPRNSDKYFAKPKKGKNSKGFKTFCAMLAVIILLSVGVEIGYLAGKNNDLKSATGSNDLTINGSVEIQQGTVPQRDGISPDENGKYTADQVAQIVSDSVVNITVYSPNGTAGAVASGVIMDKNGYILSNDHIYSTVANAKFVITLENGNSYPATYVAGDARSDLCVLKMASKEELTPAVFADSTTLKSGDDVIAIGSPYGLSGTVTKGIVSSPSRRITSSSDETNGQAATRYSMRVIQTDTALNSGNSGGALVNMYGQVVGISSSKIVLSGYEGLCFAIPSNDALKYAKSLIQYKTVKGRAKLGITYGEISSAASVISGIPSGLQINEISLDSNLYNSGLSKGDIIIEIDGTKITSTDVALDIIDSKSAGDTIKIKAYISSNKSYKTVTARLLEDTSVSSYSTQEQQTTSGFSFWSAN